MLFIDAIGRQFSWN